MAEYGWVEDAPDDTTTASSSIAVGRAVLQHHDKTEEESSYSLAGAGGRGLDDDDDDNNGNNDDDDPIRSYLHSQTTVTNATSERSEPLPPRPRPHMPTNEEERHHVHEMFGEHHYRAKILHVLHSKTVEYGLMGLLVLDVIILFVELYLSAQFPLCFIIERDAISCCPDINAYLSGEARGGGDGDGDGGDLTSNSTRWRFLEGGGGGSSNSNAADTCMVQSQLQQVDGSNDSHRFLSGGGGGGQHHGVCQHGVDTTQCPAGCDDHKYANIHYIEEVLFYCTISILGIFLIELLLLIVCLGPKVFFRKVFYVIDFVVVTSSIALELVFHFVHQDILQTIVGLIIIARLWRFVRIGHGLVEVTHEYGTMKHDKLVRYTDKLEKALKENNIPLPPRKDIEQMKRLDGGDDNTTSPSSATTLPQSRRNGVGAFPPDE